MPQPETSSELPPITAEELRAALEALNAETLARTARKAA
ncbi:MAG: hypothetical protein K0Q54_5157 [Methylobacterium brachiatum]|nr:hypothetical protein [Methylobacterium brachiatum]